MGAAGLVDQVIYNNSFYSLSVEFVFVRILWPKYWIYHLATHHSTRWDVHKLSYNCCNIEKVFNKNFWI